jgi:hypothetical protein
MSNNKKPFAFERMNYIIMLAGLLVLALGFIFMSIDKETHGFGTMGLTIGPITVLIGFAIQFVAILYKPKAEK